MLNNKGDAAMAAIMECFTSMKKKTELLYTDGETAINSYNLQEYYVNNKKLRGTENQTLHHPETRRLCGTLY